MSAYIDVHHLNMSLVLFWYKLVGGLPYIWRSGKDVKDGPMPLDALERIRLNMGWWIWSWFFGFLIIAYFSYGGIGITDIYSECATTFTVILRVEDFIGMCTTILLRIHMLGQKTRLARALVRAQMLCADYGFKAKPYYLDRHIGMVFGHHLIGFLCIWYGNISMAIANQNLPYFRIAGMFEATVKPLVLNLSMMIYSHLINLLASIYSNFIATVNDGNLQLPPTPPHVMGWTVQPITDSVSIQDLEKIHPDKENLNNINIEKAKMLLTDLFESHQMTKQYFQFLVGLTLLHSTVSSIVSCFLAAIQEDQKFPELIITFGQLLMTFFPVFFLTNIPRSLNLKREELRLTLKRLRHQKGNRNVKEKIGDLLELLEEDPGFDMGGFFILGRTRMVAILSFVATYLVILLQFRVTESTSESVVCNETSDALPGK
ncbi:uncharacterized protein [Panulirus ornatus]|uniref:uncharacterized protein n=1 Tax=Panulirus ornatus TaxID=150431 RepID=UPI003A84874D